MPLPPSARAKFQTYNEDWFETTSRLPNGSVDLVLCDPPYGTTACSWDTIISPYAMWPELLRVCKANAAIVLMGNQPFTSILICSNLELFRYCWGWNKIQPTGFLDAKRRPLRVMEDICVFYRKLPTYNPQMWSGKPMNRKPDKGGYYLQQLGRQQPDSFKQIHIKGKTERYPINLLEVSTGRSPYKKLKHPTQKPTELMKYLVLTYSNSGETVLDFAMGSGTTGVACGLTNRNFIGCDNDVDHGYYKLAVERITEAYNTRKH